MGGRSRTSCQALRGEPITVFGDGSQTRSFTYVEDEIRGFLALLDSDITTPVNIGNPAEYTIRQLAEMALEVTGSSSELTFGPLPVDDPARRQPDITLARAKLGWEPTIELRRGPGAHRRLLPPRARLRGGLGCKDRRRWVPARSSRRTSGTDRGRVGAARHRCDARGARRRTVVAGQVVALIESMKLHHEVVASAAGRVVGIAVAVGDTVRPGDLLFELAVGDVDPVSPGAPDGAASTESIRAAATGLDRPDLAEVIERHHTGLDEARPRPSRVAGSDRTARLARRRRPRRRRFVDRVRTARTRRPAPSPRDGPPDRDTPADGLVAGIATVNGGLFEGRAAQCVVMSNDYTVLAGTQGTQNHRKEDCLFELAEQLRLPIVFFTEVAVGCGDTDGTGVTGPRQHGLHAVRRAVGPRATRRRERRLLLRRDLAHGMKCIGKVRHLHVSERTRMLSTFPSYQVTLPSTCRRAAGEGVQSASVRFAAVENANWGIHVF